MRIARDSFFASFTDPLAAVRCAQALAPTLQELGLPSRFGIHRGICEMRGGEVSGLSVWAAARVMSIPGLIGEWRLHALPGSVDAPDESEHSKRTKDAQLRERKKN